MFLLRNPQPAKVYYIFLVISLGLLRSPERKLLDGVLDWLVHSLTTLLNIETFRQQTELC